MRVAQESEIKCQSDRDRTIAASAAETQSLKDRIKSLEQDLKDTQARSDRSIERSEAEIAILQARVKELQISSGTPLKEVQWADTRVKLERDITQLKADLARRNSEYRDLEKRGKELRDTYEGKVSQRGKEVEEAASRILELEARLKDGTAAREAEWTTEIEKVKEECGVLRNQLVDAEERKRELLAIVADLKGRLGTAKREIETGPGGPAAVQNLEKEIRELKAKNCNG
ncbi:hypothetical protein HDU67_004678 [Dinochytrium kinnereticum]|nr:hypothetical protein HDU67_004678 [Dinochytrium kinnereticum]